MRNLSPSHSPSEIEMEIPLPTATTEPFRLERAVCSHGLFMMAPNHWDPLSNTLTRPLRLDSSANVVVSLSQHSDRPGFLNVRVRGINSLSSQQERHLKDQVARMLRLSEAEDKAVREFTKLHSDDRNGSFCGRVFRSPTLFEDMVKCILLCNCQWPRTLSMAQALCEIQFELQNGSSCAGADSGNPKVETEDFVPKTPTTKEFRRSRKKGRKSGVSAKEEMFPRKRLDFRVDGSSQTDHVLMTDIDDSGSLGCKSCEVTKELSLDDSCPPKEIFNHIGNFPSPSELAHLDELFLAKRCKLGYRARRIIKLAQAIVEGKIQLGQLEELSKDASLTSYEELDEWLKQIEGFGPFTRANVLMCMGYYHVVPTDSETIRHLNQVHSRNSTLKTIQTDVEKIYGKYEPYQFLAYWSEIWDFYEKRFGKMNEMLPSDYKLITASNMRGHGEGTRRKRNRPS
ncbi:hypothetical protein HN51_004010 [Arachis hypogaea]|uniref:uncharacterized protein n=1 Tax=Arachis hypogaea TaxID=3818 RepID=UPI000DED2095|nr:uncharacterized protein LOC112796105 isoform X1 [Arachis hypogaea]QHO37570.1 uncharacterized protein DS421_4g112630 [Arachis hypogaea]